MHTRLCHLLEIDSPILNAPMAGAAGAALAAAVSSAGGFGMIGGSFRGRRGLRAEINRAHDLTDRRFGVGFVSHLADTAQLCEVALDSGVRVIAHSFADPTPFVGLAHDAGALVFAQIRTVEEAKRAAAGGADVIVAQGTEAGGHTGLISTLPLVPAIVDAVGPLPVIAAGGIADARGVAAVLLLGAEGVWMGTRFLATLEAAVSPWIGPRIVDAGPGDTVFTDVFDIASGLRFPSDVHTRSLRNSFTEMWHGREHELAAWAEVHRGDYLARAASTEDQGPLLAGEAVGLIGEVTTAGNVVRHITQDVDSLLRQRPQQLLA